MPKPAQGREFFQQGDGRVAFNEVLSGWREEMPRLLTFFLGIGLEELRGVGVVEWQ